jgi:hypothetical protein
MSLDLNVSVFSNEVIVSNCIENLERKESFNFSSTCRLVHHIWIQTEITQAMDLKSHVQRLRGSVEPSGFPYGPNGGLLHAAWMELRAIMESTPDGWQIMWSFKDNANKALQEKHPELFNAYKFYDGLENDLKVLAKFDRASPRIVAGRLFEFNNRLQKYRTPTQNLKDVLSRKQNQAEDKVLSLQTYEAKDREMALQKSEFFKGLQEVLKDNHGNAVQVTLQGPQFKELNLALQNFEGISKAMNFIDKDVANLAAAIKNISDYMDTPWLS